jgi:hypothetical protein
LTAVPSEDGAVPSRRRFLGRAAAALGSAGALWAAPAAARAGTDPPPTGSGGSGPPFDTYAPDLPEDPDADAGPAIQDAVDRAAAGGGGVVLVPGGEHLVRGGVELPGHVTLRGASIAATILQASRDDTASVRFSDGVEGSAVEDLTLRGAGVTFEGSASFCIVRRVRCREPLLHGVSLPRGPVDHVWLEQVTVERAGSSGVALGPGGATSVFITELSVDGFGDSTDDRDAAAVSLQGRVHASQLHIGTVRDGQVAVDFLAGSDYSTLSNYYVSLDGGEAVRVAEGVQVAIGPGAVQGAPG